MDNQPPQRFCTNCGQPLAPGVAFCGACGAQVHAPPIGAAGQFPAAAQSSSPPSSLQAQAQAPDDLLLAGLAGGSAANQARRDRLRRASTQAFRLRCCGCLLLLLAVLAGPFIGLVLTSGRLHLVFAYVAGGLVVCFLLLILIGMLATRRGREALADLSFEALLELLFGFLGGG